VDEVSDPAAADASFRIIRVFRGPKVLQNRHVRWWCNFPLSLLACPPAARTCPVG